MQSNCWSVRCSWIITCRRCSNNIFILDLTPGFHELGKYNCRRYCGLALSHQYVFSEPVPRITFSSTDCDDIMTQKHFFHHWPFVRGIYRSLMDSSHKEPTMQSFDVWCWPEQAVEQRVDLYRWFEKPWASCDVMIMFQPKIKCRIYHLYHRRFLVVVVVVVKRRSLDNKFKIHYWNDMF